MVSRLGDCGNCQAMPLDAFTGYAWVLDVDGAPALLHLARILDGPTTKGEWRATGYLTKCGKIFVRVEQIAP